MKTNFYVFLLVSFASLMTGNLISQATFGQLDESKKELSQQDIRQFLELGEEKYRQECYKDTSDNKIFDDTMNDLLDYMPDNVRKDMCEDKINQIKNQTLGSIIEGDR